jgi:hypothetical protein
MPISRRVARDRLGKHKNLVFTMAIDEDLVKQIINKHYPIKATKVELLKFIKKLEIVTGTLELVQA